MRRTALLGLLAAAALAIPATATASPSPSPTAQVQVVPLFTCVSGSFYFYNDSAVGYGDLNANRWRAEEVYTGICSNSKTASNVEFDVLGTNNCLTYAGTKSGGGYIDAITCAKKASQTWNWYSSSLFVENNYLGGSYCMDEHSLGANITMDRCRSGDSSMQWELTNT